MELKGSSYGNLVTNPAVAGNKWVEDRDPLSFMTCRTPSGRLRLSQQVGELSMREGGWRLRVPQAPSHSIHSRQAQWAWRRMRNEINLELWEPKLGPLVRPWTTIVVLVRQLSCATSSTLTWHSAIPQCLFSTVILCGSGRDDKQRRKEGLLRPGVILPSLSTRH